MNWPVIIPSALAVVATIATLIQTFRLWDSQDEATDYRLARDASQEKSKDNLNEARIAQTELRYLRAHLHHLSGK